MKETRRVQFLLQVADIDAVSVVVQGSAAVNGRVIREFTARVRKDGVVKFDYTLDIDITTSDETVAIDA